MYIDSKYFNHIANKLKKDLKGLEKQFSLIHDEYRNKTKDKKKLDLQIQKIDWRNPETNVQWEIHCSIQVNDYKHIIHYFPITTIEGKERCYITFLSNNEKIVLNSNNLIIKIYRGHFIDRYKERTNLHSLKSNEIINQFFFEERIGIIKEFIQNEEWYLYLNYKGIALVKIFKNSLVFDTFISLELLKDDQEKAIIGYLKNLPPVLYISISMYLLKNSHWGKYLKKEDRETAVRNFIGDDSLSQESKEKFILDLKSYRDWIIGND